uniref:Uncharacterized protein n=1 Tax=Oryza sativa subsp. japonica TaxID=39947 RepID=Q6YXD7_ORYSJ|nr:hypothetical protein [Oryza sativa Japonica Group]
MGYSRAMENRRKRKCVESNLNELSPIYEDHRGRGGVELRRGGGGRADRGAEAVVPSADEEWGHG